MKYLKQFLIIMGISFLGELLKSLLPFPVPASIYGMVLLFAALMTGVIKLDSVKDTGKFLIEIMPVMFIPAGVGLITTWDTLQSILIPVTVIIVVTNITVMFAAGWSSQLLIRRKGRKRHE